MWKNWQHDQAERISVDGKDQDQRHNDNQPFDKPLS